MSRPVRTAGILAALALAATACTGGGGSTSKGSGDATSSGSSSPSASTSTTAVSQKPTVGTCQALTYAQVKADAPAPGSVPCTSSHTAEVSFVGEYPAALAKSGNWKSKKITKYAADACFGPSVDYLGGRWDLVGSSLVDYWSFVAPADAFAAGDHWFSCVVGVNDEQGRKLIPVSASSKDLLTKKVPAKFIACHTARHRGDVKNVPCSRPHDADFLASVLVGNKNEPYPSTKVLDRRSQAACTPPAQRWVDKRHIKTAHLDWNTPVREAWKLGGTYAYCFIARRG